MNDPLALSNRNILIAVCGGIAAYKIPELVRLFKKSGANVRVVMTEAAQEFVTPLTLQALSGEAVRTSLFDNDAEAAMGHIDLARWADLILIAPATANMLAKIANGFADDLITTLITASTSPLFFAPAMNTQMWRTDKNQLNISTLVDRGYKQIGPNSGDLACGDTGEGRMAEPLELFNSVISHFKISGPLNSVKITVTAGPTQEPIDPVRYITNRSSGKMGFAIAEAAAQMGADVTLISGPVQLNTPAGVHRIDVTTANQMHELALSVNTDIFIACAAVADYRVKKTAPQKIKKDSEEMSLELIKNPDIVHDVAQSQPRPFTVGFAAETENLKAHALKKLSTKNLDIIAANLVGDDVKSGFDSDTNQLNVYWNGGEQIIEHATKSIVAKELLKVITKHYKDHNKSYEKD